jgi:hypothetical protein
LSNSGTESVCMSASHPVSLHHTMAFTLTEASTHSGPTVYYVPQPSRAEHPRHLALQLSIPRMFWKPCSAAVGCSNHPALARGDVACGEICPAATCLETVMAHVGRWSPYDGRCMWQCTPIKQPGRGHRVEAHHSRRAGVRALCCARRGRWDPGASVSAAAGPSWTPSPRARSAGGCVRAAAMRPGLRCNWWDAAQAPPR